MKSRITIIVCFSLDDRDLNLQALKTAATKETTFSQYQQLIPRTASFMDNVLTLKLRIKDPLITKHSEYHVSLFQNIIIPDIIIPNIICLRQVDNGDDNDDNDNSYIDGNDNNDYSDSDGGSSNTNNRNGDKDVVGNDVDDDGNIDGS